MKKIIHILTAFMVAASIQPVCAADVSQNTATKNVYVEGNAQVAAGKQITLIMADKNADKSNLAFGDIKYIEQFDVKNDGSYAIKFKYNGDASQTKMYLKYNGEFINDTVAESKYTMQIAQGDVVLLSGGNKAFEKINSNAEPSKYEYTRTINGTTYSHTFTQDYVADTADGVKAVVNLKNKYGFSEQINIIVACYDEKGALCACYADTKTLPYGENGESFKDETAVYNVPAQTKSAKAFVIGAFNDLVPYTKESNGTLDKITLFCVGDSTGQDWKAESYPQAGWGTFIKDYFSSDYVTVVNNCQSGAWAQAIVDNDTGDKCYGNGKWKKTMAAAKPGDYILVSLGINDASKCGPNGMAPEQWFAQGLTKMITDAKANGINIVMCSKIHSGEKLTDTSDTTKVMIDTMRSVCEKNDVVFLNIFDNIEKHFNDIGDLAKVRSKYFLERDTFLKDENTEFGFGLTQEEVNNHSNSYISDSSKSGNDYTHTNVRGANLTCRAIKEELEKSTSALKYYLKEK